MKLEKVSDITVGARITYYGYPIEREEEAEYRVEIYADTFEQAKSVIKRCLEAGIIDWPAQAAGRIRR